MYAMEGVKISYHPILLTGSIFIAIGASEIALMLAFRFREIENGNNGIAKIVGAFFMGGAIAGMHYTGMMAATFDSVSQNVMLDSPLFLDTGSMVISVTIGTAIILGIVLVTSFILDQRLNEEIAFKGAILESVLDCVIIIDRQGKILECNPAVTKTFGYSRGEVIGTTLEQKLLIPSSIHSFIGIDGAYIYNKRIDVTGVKENGEQIPIELTITRIKKEGAPVFTVYARDITKFKQSEKTIRKMAYRDALTGLPNRRFFNEHLSNALKVAKSQQTKLALLFLDLDRFKIINDSMGHTFGDLLLKSVAQRLQECVELDDSNVICRNGGDEFTIILENSTGIKAEDTVKKIIHSLIKPFYLEGQEIFITASLGVSMYPRDGQDQETLMKNADAAMYEAKDRGRNDFSFFNQAAA